MVEQYKYTDYVLEVATFYPRQGEWTERDYFSLPETNRRVELANGELLVSPSPSNQHQAISLASTLALGNYVKQHQLGVIRYAPHDVRLFSETIRQPDIFFVRKAHQDRFTGQVFDGGPDWIAEIISPGDREIDEQVKLVEYAKAGVPEYWLVDPEHTTIRIYTLKEKAYELVSTSGAGEIAQSVTLKGFQVSVDEVFSES